MSLDTGFCDTRKAAGAVMQLHFCHSVALLMMSDVDLSNFLTPLKPYGIMKLAKLQLLPFFLPGDPASFAYAADA